MQGAKGGLAGAVSMACKREFEEQRVAEEEEDEEIEEKQESRVRSRYSDRAPTASGRRCRMNVTKERQSNKIRKRI